MAVFQMGHVVYSVHYTLFPSVGIVGVVSEWHDVSWDMFMQMRSDMK